MEGFLRGLAATWLAMLPGIVTAQAAPVTVQTIESSRTAAPLVLSGTFTARQRSDLSTAVAGLVQELRVDVGDTVAADDILIRLDSELAELQLASLRAAETEAEALRDEAKRQAEQARELARSGDLSASLAQTRIAESATAQAQFASRRAAAQQQAAVVQRHTLRAPYAGVITARLTDTGEWAVPGTPILELVDLAHLWLDVQVPQARFADITPETTVTIRTPALPDQTLDASVQATVPVSDPTARTLRVRLAVNNAQRQLLPGMSAQADFHVQTDSELVLAPRDALIRRPDGAYGVWVIAEDDGVLRAAARRVRTGRNVGSEVEIRDGVQAGGRVIVRGNEGLSDGQAVRIVDRIGQSGS